MNNNLLNRIVPEEIGLLIDAGALFVCNDSGGKDSQVMRIFLKHIIPEKQLIIVHANLPEVEWEGNFEQITRYAGITPVFEVKANKTFFEMVAHRFKTRPEVPSWPSPSTRQCTSDLKRGPIQKFIRKYAKENGFLEVVNCLGIRAEESPARKKKNPFKFKLKDSCKHREQYEWLPVHDLLLNEVWAGITNSNQRWHYAYNLGMSRLSCKICIMSNDDDLRIAGSNDPKLTQRYIDFEEWTGYTIAMSRIPLKNTIFNKTS